MKATFFLAAVLFSTRLFAQAPEYGPAKGTLVIQGGGSDAGTGIFETFINPAGGLDAKIIVVPKAAVDNPECKGGRGRDDGYPSPPTQIRACATKAHGSYLG